MAEFEKAWARIRATAEQMASKGETPSRHQAETIVLQIVDSENCPAPPADAVEYLGRELRSFIESARRGTRSTKSTSGVG